MKLRNFMLLVTFACLALGACIGVYNQTFAPVIPDRLLDQLSKGDPANHVEQVLGAPNERVVHESSEFWTYWRGLNPGFVTISFDSQGLLVHINDESVIPRHQRRPNSPSLP